MAGRDVCELLCLDLPRAEAVRASLPRDVDVVAASARAGALADPTRLLVATARMRAGWASCRRPPAWP